MAIIDRPLRISQINIAELRAVLLGPSPRVMGKVVFGDDAGQTFAQSVNHAWSAETYALLKKLIAQMEEDTLQVMAADGYELDPDGGEYVPAGDGGEGDDDGDTWP